MTTAPKPPVLVIGTVEYPLGPLSFKALREHSATIKAMAEGRWDSSDALFAAMASIVHASASRRAPELELDAVEATLDWPLAKLLVEQVLVQSFPQQPEGEGRAVSPSGSSTGTAQSPN